MAVSFAVGTVIGFVASIHLAKKIRFCISWRDLSAVMMIPLGISFTFGYFSINYILAILATTAISYIVFMKLEILKRHEVQDTLNLLPDNIGKPIIEMINVLGRKLNPKY